MSFPLLGEREGPDAKRWEGEGAALTLLSVAVVNPIPF